VLLNPIFNNEGSNFAYSYLDAKNISSLAVSSGTARSDRPIAMPGSNLLDYAWSPGGKSLSVLAAVRSGLFRQNGWAVRHFHPEPAGAGYPGNAAPAGSERAGRCGRRMVKSLLQVVTEQLPGAGTSTPPQQRRGRQPAVPAITGSISACWI